MIDETEARQRVADCLSRLPAIELPLDETLGKVLAADVASDIDSPPYDKALVDGYAVCSQDFAEANAEVVTTLRVLEEVTAGRTPSQPLRPGCATRIMTGAPLPEGCDAVVMIEQSQLDGDQVRLTGEAQPEQHLLRAGAAMRRGDLVLRAGVVIRAAEIGVLAEVGCARPSVVPAPTVAILSTGDELVPHDQTPTLGQIRNSNGPMLAAMARQAGAKVMSLGIATDDAADLERLIREGLRADMLVLSGGVSAGVLDLAPQVLRQCGVDEVFHKVRLKPGKPVWFGRSAAGVPVFGLPGNPVGSLVCFERLVRPALALMRGLSDPFEDRSVDARLAAPFSHRGPRPTYRPSRLCREEGVHVVAPVAWQGSADLCGIARANCLAAFPAGDRDYAAGEFVRCLPLD
ncbi:MAG: molybdopterin molybdotransferase MoeA [Planctomycetales bacterium]|nr:molybdopterin molybdotransferase MoeA [Planctomycetales bacterium]